MRLGGQKVQGYQKPVDQINLNGPESASNPEGPESQGSSVAYRANELKESRGFQGGLEVPGTQWLQKS